MKNNNPIEKVLLPKITHSVRASQAVLQYGVGAMVDFPDQTLMTAAPEFWSGQIQKIHDERLEKALQVDYFGMPGNMGELKYDEGISYVRFPEWYFCPICKTFKPISKWIDTYRKKGYQKHVEKDPYMVSHMRCPNCHQDLIVARIITVCGKGHIDDFPWVKWVHCQNYGVHKEICNSPELEFWTSNSSSEGLDAIEVKCKSCGARASLRSAMETDIFEKLDDTTNGKYNFKCTGRHPWKHSREACGEYPKAFLRGSSSVYFPVIESSLVIPPYSNLLNTRIEESVAYSKFKETLAITLRMPGLDTGTKEQIKLSILNEAVREIALQICANEQEVREVLKRKWFSTEMESYSTLSTQYRAEEYEALRGKVKTSLESHGDFVWEGTDIRQYDIPFVSNISLIHKIREVQALTGYTRIKPNEKSEDGLSTDNVVSIKNNDDNWYPAYQVRGEGIFLEFDQDSIDSWLIENEFVQRRVEIINTKYRESFFGKSSSRQLTGKFLILHTISHLLIKQLSFECGYSISSVKERIYCSEESEGKRMAGILIYTASGDSEGTLGGLVRQGRQDTLPSIFKKAIESATTCSNDPVCSLSQGQGRDSLNLAACYSCTLIPETSCEVFNIFLDRGVVVGTFENRQSGLYSACLFSKDGWSKTEYVSDNTEDRAEKKSKKRMDIIIRDGVDTEEITYKDIWRGIGQWITSADEKSVIYSFEEASDRFEGKEKPLQDCEFSVSGNEEVYTCDLVWKSSGVMLFLSENKDEYLQAKQSNWKCFLSIDEETTINELLEAIEV